VVLAISLDIVNAFNSLPWPAIREALVYHRMPPYLRRIVGAYLRDRTIRFPSRNSTETVRTISCGVPQGSVLGPLLWNLAYDAVLRTSLPPGTNVVCYADDTLLLTRAVYHEEAVRLAELAVARVIGSIRALGLRIAPHKTEAMWFHKLRRGAEPPSSCVRVGDAEVRVGRHLKYLGLTLSCNWRFEEHFERLVPRVRGAAGALHRLLPNLGGPHEEVRRLYGSVVRSMALYGAPVWASCLASSSRCRAILNSLQRIMAIRVARGYRTISFEAATVLARSPPFDILAEMDARVYDQTRVPRRAAGGEEPDILFGRLRQNEHRRAMEDWRARLQEPRCVRQRAVATILPCFEDWMERREGRVTFRLTQILTGHGCFGEYLNRIGREETAQCHHCGSDRDSAQHTLEDCPAWESERRVLVAKIGQDLCPSAIVKAMLTDAEGWKAMTSFCEAVMRQKEAAERDRERADPARRRRQRRGGRNPR
jgi:hypothetical protein